jgi:hypothetical protein
MKDNRKFWGVALLIIGILFLMDRLGVFDVRWFFRGWWTLFLIIPALYTMFKNGIQTGNVILLGIGIYFLLQEWGIDMGWVVIPAVMIVLGVSLLIRKN